MAGKAGAFGPVQWRSLRHDGRYSALRLDSHSMSFLPCVLSSTKNHSNSLQAGANGAQQAGSWACRETFVAVVIGNAPMIYPLFRRVARRAGIYLTTKSGSQSYPAYPLSDGDTSGYARRKKFRHPLSIPADTQWNTTTSDEHMILPSSRQQPPTCTAGDGDWETASHASHSGGIKVVHETIVHSAEKESRL